MSSDSATAAPPTATRAGAAPDEVPGGERSVSAALVTIKRPARELYDFWRNFANLAGFMENIAGIVVADAARSTWTVKAPGGRHVSWDALVVEDEPGRLIGWRSAEGSEIANSGRIEFTDVGERGTVVRAVIGYDPPGGAAGQLLAKLFQREPAIQARRDLRRFKMLMETGEVATSARTRAHAAAHQAG